MDALYLDTTYCDEAYAFADQEAALAGAVEGATAALRAAPRLLLVVGAYAVRPVVDLL